jgi:hypothetical protein
MKQPWDESVAVKGNKITHVESNSESKVQPQERRTKMKVSKNEERMSVSDNHENRDGSIGARSEGELLKRTITEGPLIDRRTFTAWLLAAPFVMKAGLAAAALDFPAARADSGDPLCYASVDELIAMFKAGKASPVDLLKAQIKRIEALNPKVNCITYTHFDQALKEAKQSEDRYRRGNARPLEGITVSLKDEVGFLRPGWRTTQGSLNGKRSRHRHA